MVLDYRVLSETFFLRSVLYYTAAWVRVYTRLFVLNVAVCVGTFIVFTGQASYLKTPSFQWQALTLPSPSFQSTLGTVRILRARNPCPQNFRVKI